MQSLFANPGLFILAPLVAMVVLGFAVNTIKYNKDNAPLLASLKAARKSYGKVQ